MYVEIAVLAHLLPFVIIFIFLLSQGQTRQRGGFVLSLHVYSDEFKEPLRGKSKLFGFNGQLHLLHPPSRRGSLRQFPAEEDEARPTGWQQQEGTEAKHLGWSVCTSHASQLRRGKSEIISALPQL